MRGPSNFSLWMRSNLRDAYSGLITQDIDFVLTRSDNRYIILEEKIYKGARTGPAQAIIFQLLDSYLSHDPFFLGCHKVTLENNDTIYVDDTYSTTLDCFVANPLHRYRNNINQTWFDKIILSNLSFLWDCNGAPRIKKTEQEHSFDRTSKIASLFPRKNLICSSLDWIFVNYCSGYFAFLIEGNGNIQENQLRLLNFLSENSSNIDIFNPKSNAKYKYLGCYYVEHEDDFETFYINQHKVQRIDAIKALNLENDEIRKYS